MNLIQLQSICKTAKGRESCAIYLDSLNQYMPLYGINTPQRVAAFLAQVAHESADFTRVSENLNYSAQGLAATWPNRFRSPNGQPNELAFSLHRNPIAIANNVYANRMGNGPEESGDGWRYRGRGLKQLTGKDNYARCGASTGLPLVDQPELLEQPEGAVLSAVWFWEYNRLNHFADTNDFRELTRRINGGYIGLPERMQYFASAKAVVFA